MATPSGAIQLMLFLTILDTIVGGFSSNNLFQTNGDSNIRFLKRNADLEFVSGENRQFVDDGEIIKNNLILERHRRDTNSPSLNISCNEHVTNFGSNKQSYTFAGDLNNQIALKWAGMNNGILLLLTYTQLGALMQPPTLYRSEDYGASFTDITSKINNAYISTSAGFQESPIHVEWLILMSVTNPSTLKNSIHVTKDGGNTFTMIDLPFNVGSDILFHPTEADWLLMTSSLSLDNAGLWLSKDFGKTWKNIHNYVAAMKWGRGHFDKEETIYIAVDPKETLSSLLDADEPYTLMKTDNLGSSFNTISDEVFSYGVQDRFLYITRGSDDVEGVKVMHVSTDGGDTWNVAKLPYLSDDKFVLILDMSEGMVFMHVSSDLPGHGTIYTSDSEGIVFSESLQNHFLTIDKSRHLMTDFYKVKSLRGVYLTSQLSYDDSFTTAISYDRGATWHRIPAPEGELCVDQSEDSECSLQIHNVYSELTIQSVHMGPLTTDTATGIILAHGHVATSLRTSEPDVFVTSNGGYTWSKVLNGPHFYAILDHGSLLIAVPSEDPDVNIIQFSYDEGQCWSLMSFADEPIHILGIVTEPMSKSMKVGIWGYGAVDDMWRVITIDFSSFLTEQCDGNDYELWFAHENNGMEGCLLGTKETYRRLKPDSFCRNGYNYEVSSEKTPCTCSKSDYECDYGYYRLVGVIDCIPDPEFDDINEVLCIDGKKMMLKTSGYRKIPGDICEGGIQPSSSYDDTGLKCDVDGGFIQSIRAIVKKHKTASAVAAFLVSVVGITCASMMVVYFIRKCRQLNKSGKFRYNYSQLNQSDEFINDLENPSSNTDSAYHDDSDVDLIQ